MGTKKPQPWTHTACGRDFHGHEFTAANAWCLANGIEKWDAYYAGADLVLLGARDSDVPALEWCRANRFPEDRAGLLEQIREARRAELTADA